MTLSTMPKDRSTLSPFLKWAGGKRWLTRRYLQIFQTDHNRYFEPFLGSGAVYFAISPKTAVLSDKNSDLINLFQVIKDKWKQFTEILILHHNNHSKDYYYAVRGNTNEKDNIIRAANFLYLNRTCWNGLYRVNTKGTFNVPIGTKSNVMLPQDDFKACSDALQSTKLMSCDFEETIDATENNDLLFIDPPYTVRHNNNCFVKYNENLFAWSDQVRLRDALIRARDRGVKIIATNAAHDSIKELYNGSFGIEEVLRQSVIAGNSAFRKECAELLIRGNI